MKQTIPASAIAGINNFAAVAQAHAVEMKAWRSHMARVKEDAANDVPIERRHVARLSSPARVLMGGTRR
jgi:hypothetical protein